MTTVWSNHILRELKVLQKHGFKGWLRQVLTISDVKTGTLVGKDRFGNAYYEQKNEMSGRERFVIYNQPYSWTVEASEVPPEWHQWMHKMVDEPPTESTRLSKPKFVGPHVENYTLSAGAFKTYNTTKPKYESWQPSVKSRQG